MRFVEGKRAAKCRVGMSTDPFERIRHWMDKEDHTNFDIIEGDLTYDEAQRLEEAAAADRGCTAEPGGPRKPGRVWAVYVVWTE